MKKSILVISILFIFYFSNAMAKAPKHTENNSNEVTTMLSRKTEVRLLNKRIEVISNINEDCLNIREKQFLKKEVLEIKKGMHEIGKENFPFAAIIIIIYYLIILS